MPLLAHYAGSIDLSHPLFADAQLNTDNLPIIEYRAPINHRLEKAGRREWFVGVRMLDFTAQLIDRNALASDAYLSRIDPVWHGVIQAGYYFYAYKVLQKQEHEDAEAARSTHKRLLQNTASKINRRTSQ